MKKYIAIILGILILGLTANSNAQNNSGTIIGLIKTSDGKPAEMVNVKLKGTFLGGSTNRDGLYQINNVPAGKYTLVVSYVGFETKSLEVEIEIDQVTNVKEIILNEAAKELGEVIIEDNRINKFSDIESEYVAKIPLKNLENPQVYNSINLQLLKDQVITSFDDVLKNAPGIQKLWESTGRGGDGAGYYSLRGFAVQPTMVNGLPGLTNGSFDPANIERVEVIKGPSGTLYGSSLISYGGLINVVTKKPYNQFGSEISYMPGSFGLNRISADINSPLYDKKNIALRVVAAYHNENSFQDAGFKKSTFIAPSLSYQVDDKLSFLIGTEFYSSEQTNTTMLFLNRSAPLAVKNLNELNYNPRRSYTSNDITVENPAFNLQGQMKYKLSDSWTSQTALSKSSAKSDGDYSYLWDLADGNGSFTRYFSKQNSNTSGTDIQQNFIGNFEIGSLENKIVLGVDYYNQTTINNSTGYVAYDIIKIGNADPNNLSRSSLDTALAKAAASKNNTESEIYSAYISDVINFTSRLSAMASLRIDHFNNKGTYNALIDTTTGNFNQTALSPKFGIVYELIPNGLSLFGNYMNGFKNAAPRIQNDGSTISFKPEQANQWETGIKTNIYNGKLTATLSYYDVLVSNVVREDPNKVNYYIQDGENYSKGFEASIIAEPVKGLNIIAGYSHNESKITKTDNPEYEGRRPENSGPKNLINFWISYLIRGGFMNGLGIGFGGNYAGEYATLNRASTGTFVLPAYTVLNASLFYDAGVFRLTFKMNNLTDKEYYKGWSTINPQKPRNYSADISFSF